MFVELENGELLNLDYVVRIFVEKQNVEVGTRTPEQDELLGAEDRNSESCSVTAEYVSGGTVHFGVIHCGTERQCNFVLNMLRNSLDMASTEFSAEEMPDNVQ